MKFSICNEVFGNIPFSEQCRYASKAGLKGMEISPSHLFKEASLITQKEIENTQSELDFYNLDFTGFHWLLAGNEELNIFSADKSVSLKTRNRMDHLIETAGKLGGGSLIFGSPSGRIFSGIKKRKTEQIFINYLKELVPLLDFAGCTLLLEPLPRQLTNFMNNLEECRVIANSVNSDSVGIMFDFHNTNDEIRTVSEIADSWGKYIKHIHINDLSGQMPSENLDLFYDFIKSVESENREVWSSFEIFGSYENSENLTDQITDFLEGYHSYA